MNLLQFSVADTTPLFCCLALAVGNMSAAEEKPAEKLPNLELQQWAFLLSLPDGMVPKKAEIKQKLMDYITANGSFLIMFFFG